MTPSFTVSAADAALIKEIAARRFVMARLRRQKCDKQHVAMNITACHANGNPLRLRDLLAADDFNFIHDVDGIDHHICRTTGKLLNHFSPRFSAPQAPEANQP